MDNFVQSITRYASYQEESLKKEIYEKIINFSDDIMRLRISLNKEQNFDIIKNDLLYIQKIKQEREEKIKAQQETMKAQEETMKAQEETMKERELRIKIQENSILRDIENHIKFRANKKQFEEMLNLNLKNFKELKENNILNIIESVEKTKKESFIESLNNFLLKNNLKSDIEFPDNFQKIDIVFKEIKKYIEDKQYNKNKNQKNSLEEENSNKHFDRLKNIIKENVTEQHILFSIEEKLMDSGILKTPDVDRLLKNINFNKKIENNSNNLKL